MQSSEILSEEDQHVLRDFLGNPELDPFCPVDNFFGSYMFQLDADCSKGLPCTRQVALSSKLHSQVLPELE
jgi:hypothetical protein